MAAKPVDDAKLIAFMRVRSEHEELQAAAEAFGIPATTALRWERMAKKRGLTGKELTAEAKLRIENAALRRDLRAAERENDSAEKVRQEIFNLAAHTPEPPAWITPAPTKKGTRGTPMTIWSDWHYGEVVRPEEVGGVNIFNADVAAERIRMLVDVTVDLCMNHMGRADTKYPGIVVCLGGDMITGDIHDELTATNDRTTHQSVNDLTDLIAAALEHLAAHFGRVFVPCVVGNHGRSTRKPRMKGRVYTSYEYILYCSLERHFRNDKRVQFYIPGESDAYFKVYDHRFLLTHGDSLGVKGGDGIIGPLGPITRGVIKIRNSEMQIGRDIDTVLMGHWHTLTWGDGYIVNGALKGYDEYARLALRARYTRPSQALWFVHPEQGLTAHWPVHLDKTRTVEDAGEWIGWRTEP